MNRSDVLVGGASALTGAAVFLYTLTFPAMPDGAPGPGLFPRILAGLLVMFGVVLMIQARGVGSNVGARYSSAAIAKAGGVLVAIAIYIAVVQRLGFLPTAFLLLVSLMLMLGVKVRVALPTAALVTGLCVLLFEKLLRVPLPLGVLGA